MSKYCIQTTLCVPDTTPAPLKSTWRTTTMKTPRFFYGALAAVPVIGTAGAAAMTQQGTANNSKDKAGQFGLTQMLDNLTAKGYDFGYPDGSDGWLLPERFNAVTAIQGSSSGCISCTRYRNRHRSPVLAKEGTDSSVIRSNLRSFQPSNKFY